MTKKQSDNWMFALILIPVISFVLMGIGYFVLYSLLVHTTLGSTDSIKLIAVVLTLLVPGITSKLFSAKSFFVVMIWIGFTMLAFALNKSGEGNQKEALVIHFLGFQMAATAVSTMLITYQLMNAKK